MKKKLTWLALIIVSLGVFVAARQLATWRPQTISHAEFVERAGTQPTAKPVAKPTVNPNSLPAPQPQSVSESEFAARAAVTPQKPVDFWSKNLSASAKRLKRLAKSQKLEAHSLSPDGRLLLAASNEIALCHATILSANDGHIVARLAQPRPDYCDEGGAQWTRDSGLVAFSQFEVSATQVFDARTGAHLWGGDYWGETFRFSPDNQFAALTDVNGRFLSVREIRSGRELKRLPLKKAFTDNWNFSRDSNYLVAEIAPGEFRQLRLR